MAGYDHDLGMSNNAVDAYCDGRKPLSKINLEDLRNAGWTKTRTLALSLAKIGFWQSCEWHHSGGTWFNEVKFFDPNDLVEEWDELTDAEKQVWQNKTKHINRTPSIQRVIGKYAEWGGSRNHPKIMGYVDFEGTLRGNWITTDDGQRKKADGKWIQYKILN
tara:strand:- start:46 stop:531 length:486 start_codon:yes stop_codon:yes gene_type:complete